MLTPLPRADTLGVSAAERLEGLITEAHYRPGDRLPSERELAERFAVSRTVIREAVRTLVAKGWLEVKPGSGTLVCAPSQQTVVRSVAAFMRFGKAQLDYRSIHEVRRVLEVEIAGLAAQRRTPDDLVALERHVEAMQTLRGDPAAFARNDLSFHGLLGKATQNQMFALLLDSVADILFRVREVGNIVPGAPDHAIAHHRRILERVTESDVSGARGAMLEHLLDSEKIFNQAMDAFRQPIAP